MNKVLKVMILTACLALFYIPLSNASAASVKNQWVQQNHHWYYYNAKGSLQKGWLLQGKKWYLFNPNGVMQTGWVKVQNKWYFFDGSGAMKTGWLKSGSTWYYLNPGGDMQTGWEKIGGAWYFFLGSGAWDGKTNTQPPQASINFAVTGTATASPGIYSSVPNGKSTLVLKENNYNLANTTTPPLTLEDATHYAVKGSIAKTYNQYNLNNPIQSVQTVGKDMYFTKFLFFAEYAGGNCGGGYVDVLELDKRAANGAITKVTADKMSTHTTQQFFISGSNLYYAKIENAAFSNYTIVKSSLDGKTKTTLATGVDDFWVNQGTIYYEKGGKISSMDLNGKNIQTVSKIQTKLYTSGGCAEGDYSVSNNGVTVIDYNANGPASYFYDFAAKTITGLPFLSGYWITDVDPGKRLIAAEGYDSSKDKDIIALYDFNGKLQKTLLTDNYNNFTILSLDVKKGEFLYSTGSSLKLVKF